MVQSQLLVLIVIIALIQLFVVAQTQRRVTPKVIAGGGIDQCPLQGERRAVIENISKGVVDTLQLQEHQCGDGICHHVAYLNMSDPSQQCPPAWREYNESGVRACGRRSTFGESCQSTIYLHYKTSVQQSVW
jgi:hypothetical protein